MKLNMPKSGIDNVLFQALRAVYQFERDKVSRFGLTYEGIYLLQYLRRYSPCRMGDIATEMRVPISTATRVVDRLQKQAFVSRHKDPYDRRSILLSLEPAGEAVVQEVEQHSYERLQRNLAYFTERDFEAFTRTALSLDKLLNGPDVNPPGENIKPKEKR